MRRSVVFEETGFEGAGVGERGVHLLDFDGVRSIGIVRRPAEG